MKLLRIVMVAGLVLASATPVHAEWVTLFQNMDPGYCGGSSFETCAGITLKYEWESSGVALFELNVSNLGRYGEMFNTVGLINLPTSVSLDGSTAPDGWSDKNSSLSGEAVPPVSFSYNAPNPVPQGDTGPGWTGSFSFTVSGFPTGWAMESVGVGIHAISGPNDCSTKLGVINGEPNQGPYDPYCASTVVPEPGTIFLLGTGLAGLGVVIWRRREEDE